MRGERKKMLELKELHLMISQYYYCDKHDTHLSIQYVMLIPKKEGIVFFNERSFLEETIPWNQISNKRIISTIENYLKVDDSNSFGLSAQDYCED